MNLNDVFDSAGLDGVDNQKSWNKLPNILKYFISSTQSMIMEKVKKKVEQEYGQNGLQSLVKTSGYRSVVTNHRVGGVADSLHLFGCAIDFGKFGIFKSKPIPTCCNLECIDSGSCWHVQLKRGDK